MDLIQNAKNILGDKCIGVSLNSADYQNYQLVTQPMRFCEAVFNSFNSPLAINKLLIDCPGARRCLKITAENNKLINEISMHGNLSKDFIISALKEIPVISKPLHNIVFANNGKPDLLIAYTTPDKVVGVLIKYAQKLQEKPLLAPYFIMSMCGNIFVRSIETGKITISFGCPESRKYAGINEDEIIIGIPGKVATKLFS